MNNNIVVIGVQLDHHGLLTIQDANNWELCLTIVNSLAHAVSSGELECRLTVLTFPSQTLSLPPHVSSSMVKHTKSDFSTESLRDAFQGQDLVISTISGGDADLQINIVDAAIEAGVKKFVPHEFGHDTLNKSIQSRIRKYAGRSKVLEHLQMVTKSHTKFEWVGIATGYTLDKGLINGDLGFDLEWHSATIHGIGTELFAASSLKRVGAVILAVLNVWDNVKNKYIYAAGTITSANEVLRSAEKVTGHQWTVGNYDVETCVREGQSRIEKGFPDAGMTLLERSVLYDEELDACAPFKFQSSNTLLGLYPEPMEQIVATAYHDLKHYGKPGCGCSA